MYEPAPKATDWNRYHERMPVLARMTRRYIRSVLLGTLRRHAPRDAIVVELGGGNSFFAASIMRELSPREYHAVDSNSDSLLMLERNTAKRPLFCHHEDILATTTPVCADVVFSIGLIEHFNARDRPAAVRAHLQAARPGGLVVISFPIPTLSYRCTRAVAEHLNLWMFHDETPLNPLEVAQEITRQARILEQHTLWPIVLTQHMIAAVRT